MSKLRTIGAIFGALVLGAFAFFASFPKGAERKITKVAAPKKERTEDQNLFI